jgi:hypothetical protein
MCGNSWREPLMCEVKNLSLRGATLTQSQGGCVGLSVRATTPRAARSDAGQRRCLGEGEEAMRSRGRRVPARHGDAGADDRRSAYNAPAFPRHGRGPVASRAEQTVQSGSVRERTHGLSMPAHLTCEVVDYVSRGCFLWPIGHAERSVALLAAQSAERMLRRYGRRAFAPPCRLSVLA